MKASRSIMASTHRDDGSRLSSSLPQQPVFSLDTPLQQSQNQNPLFYSSRLTRRGESTTLEESVLAQRSAQRQLRGNQRHLLQRSATSKDGRSSTLATQPVLVRSYDAGADVARPSTNMSNPAVQAVDLPSVEDFGIEAILRAIEPEIRSTLDSIAEICGRSKLSLANEYDSHIAPFGEVNPPSGELLAIQENAPINAEGAPADVDGHIVISDDENDLYSSPLGMLDDLRQTALATGYQRSLRVERSQETHSNQSRRVYPPKTGTRRPVVAVTRMEEFAATSKPGSKAFLGNNPTKTKTSKAATKTTAAMTSPALLSEIHLDAQGNRSSWPSEPPDTPRESPILPASSFTGDRAVHGTNTKDDRIFPVADIQDWLSWLKMIIQREKAHQQPFHAQSHSAEYSLRTLLIRNQDRVIPVPTT